MSWATWTKDVKFASRARACRTAGICKQLVTYAVENCIHCYMWLEIQDGVLRTMFGSKRGEVTGEWRKLHNEGLRDLYCSTIIIRVTN
jgi:hypothetical protein